MKLKKIVLICWKDEKCSLGHTHRCEVRKEMPYTKEVAANLVQPIPNGVRYWVEGDTLFVEQY